MKNEIDTNRIYKSAILNNIMEIDNLKVVYENKMIRQNLIEKDLLVSELRYRRIFETAKDGIIIIESESGLIIDVNNSLLLILDQTYFEIIKKQIWEIKIFNNIFENKKELMETINKDSIKLYNIPILTKNNKVVNVNFESNSYVENQKNMIQCHFKRTDDNHHIGDKLILSKININEKNQFLKMGFWEYNTLKNEMQWSKSVYLIFRILPFDRKLTFKDFFSRIYKPDRFELLKKIKNAIVLKKDYEVEFRIDLHNSQFKWLYAKVYQSFDENTLISCKGICFDITNRKLTEDILIKSKFLKNSFDLTNNNSQKNQEKKHLNNLINFSNLISNNS